MAEKEIKIGFPEAKMEALTFFLGENNETVESVLKAHLDKTYEKTVPQQVRKFVDSRMAPTEETASPEESTDHAQTRGRSRRGARQNAAREASLEQERSSLSGMEEVGGQDAEQQNDEQQESGIAMGM